VADTSAVAAAARRLGGAVLGAGLDERALQTQDARAKAASAVVDRQTRVKEIGTDIVDRLNRGELDHAQARQAYQYETGKLEEPAIEYLDPAAREGMVAGFKRAAEGVGFEVQRAAETARRKNYQAQFADNLDKLAKQVGLVGTDTGAVNAQADAFRPLAQEAGMPPDLIERELQRFRDNNWTQDAKTRLNAVGENLDGLKVLQRDLTAKDGFYADKLDPEKRTALVAAVQSRRDQLLNRIQMQADRREAKAERVLNEIDRQIASGVPATPEMWADWATKVSGTAAAGEFKARVDDEKEVQAVLRMPVADQLKFVQDREAELLTSGGDLRKAANVARLSNAVKQNVALLQNAPLVYQANRMGEEPAPIDMGELLTDGDAPGVRAQFAERAATLSAMRKQLGTQVPLRPLLPQEAQALTSTLGQTTPRQQAAVLGRLRQTIADDKLYQAALQQIAPDAPVTAIAGMLAGKQTAITLERKTFSPDVVAASPEVAATVLEGQALLNPSKAAKGEDGKPAPKLFLPESKTLQQSFADAVGNAFAGRPGAADVAFQVAQSYYVGKAARTGRLATQSADVDPKLVREAITATLGSVVDFNGNGQVIAPWGMDAATFNDQARIAFEAEVKRRGLPPDTADRLSLFGLRNRGESSYYVTQGRGFLTDPKGQPVIITLGAL
jgi:hypothetical protein